MYMHKVKVEGWELCQTYNVLVLFSRIYFFFCEEKSHFPSLRFAGLLRLEEHNYMFVKLFQIIGGKMGVILDRTAYTIAKCDYSASTDNAEN